MRFVSAAEVHRLLNWPSLIDALREAHLAQAPRTARLLLEEPREAGHPNILLTLPAWQPGEAIGVKLVTSFPDNVAEHGLPTVNAIYALFDGRTGLPRAVIDGEALIFRKTAADSALGTSLLARADIETMLMIGAGALAPYLVAAHRTARPSIQRVTIWNRTAHRAAALAASLREEGVEAIATEHLDAAVSKADLVSCATMSEMPLLKGQCLKRGAHVDLVGSFTPAMREADDEALRRARVFVDSYGILDRSGEFVGPLQRGVIARDHVVADLFELCRRDRRGRSSRSEITLFKNGGGAHLDLFVARHLLAVAETPQVVNSCITPCVA